MKQNLPDKFKIGYLDLYYQKVKSEVIIEKMTQNPNYGKEDNPRNLIHRRKRAPLKFVVVTFLLFMSLALAANTFHSNHDIEGTYEFVFYQQTSETTHTLDFIDLWGSNSYIHINSSSMEESVKITAIYDVNVKHPFWINSIEKMLKIEQLDTSSQAIFHVGNRNLASSTEVTGKSTYYITLRTDLDYNLFIQTEGNISGNIPKGQKFANFYLRAKTTDLAFKGAHIISGDFTLEAFELNLSLNDLIFNSSSQIFAEKGIINGTAIIYHENLEMKLGNGNILLKNCTFKNSFDLTTDFNLTLVLEEVKIEQNLYVDVGGDFTYHFIDLSVETMNIEVGGKTQEI